MNGPTTTVAISRHDRPCCDPLQLAKPDAGAASAIELPGLIGGSAASRNLYARALGLADAGHPILISGGAGSGKSALARALHRASRRRERDLRVMRSVAFPDFLSGADGARAAGDATEPGARFADLTGSGTLILDEIGDLSAEAQARLLQLLRSTSGPVNLIALTHMNLPRLVGNGRFRSDLLECLNRERLVLPNLTERQEDLNPLAERFRERLAATNRRVQGFSECAFRAMHRHRWPGNLRELRNRVERAMLLSPAESIRAVDLGLPTPCV